MYGHFNETIMRQIKNDNASSYNLQYAPKLTDCLARATIHNHKLTINEIACRYKNDFCIRNINVMKLIKNVRATDEHVHCAR